MPSDDNISKMSTGGNGYKSQHAFFMVFWVFSSSSFSSRYVVHSVQVANTLTHLIENHLTDYV